jgi:hypothetical protein
MIFWIRVEVDELAKKGSFIAAGINALAGLFGLSGQREQWRRPSRQRRRSNHLKAL